MIFWCWVSLPKVCLNAIVYFPQIIALFPTFPTPTTYPCLLKYCFGFVLVAQPFFQSSCEFILFQMGNCTENCNLWYFNP